MPKIYHSPLAVDGSHLTRSGLTPSGQLTNLVKQNTQVAVLMSPCWAQIPALDPPRHSERGNWVDGSTHQLHPLSADSHKQLGYFLSM